MTAPDYSEELPVYLNNTNQLVTELERLVRRYEVEGVITKYTILGVLADQTITYWMSRFTSPGVIVGEDQSDDGDGDVLAEK